MVGQFYFASLALAQSSPWYDNGWVVGIATGVASGAFLAVVTPLFLRRRKAKDLAIRRERAADDVLSALRPSVATGYLPSASTVEAITRASAYRRGLNPKLSVSTLTIIDVLISEIMVTAFLGPEVRLSEAKQLLELRADLDHQPAPVKPSQDGNYASESVAASTAGALILGSAAAVSSNVNSWVPIVATLAVVVIGVFGYFAINGRRLTQIKLGGVRVEFSPTSNIVEIGRTAGDSADRAGADGESPRSE